MSEKVIQKKTLTENIQNQEKVNDRKRKSSKTTDDQKWDIGRRALMSGLCKL